MKTELIILHGALGCGNQFTAWKQGLDKDFSCHAPDFSGHGSKAAQAIEFSIQKFSQDLAGHIQKHNLRKPHILGYSMGGYVALYTALHQPGLIGSIMTIATKFDWSPEIARREAGYLKPALMWEKVPQLAEQLRSHHGSHWKAVVEKTARMMLMLGEAPPVTIDNIAQVTNQIKFCVGDKDKMVSVHETHGMYKAAANASLCVLPDTGHLPESMRTDKIIFEAREFFLQPAGEK